ncbi:MAG: hypothetical protein WCW84_00695 [Sulfurimonas sp.]
MQKAFLKVAFVGLLSVSSVFATEGSLLSQATDGAVATNNASLTQNEMSEVKGGIIYTGIGSTYFNANTKAVASPVTTKSSIYASSFGKSYWGR